MRRTALGCLPWPAPRGIPHGSGAGQQYLYRRAWFRQATVWIRPREFRLRCYDSSSGRWRPAAVAWARS